MDKRLIGLFVALAVLVTDQFTKFLVTKHIPYRHSVEIIDGYLKFTYIRNPNSVFGISLGKNFPYSIAALITLTVLVVLLLKEDALSFIIIYGLLIGGALGNLLDRLRFKEVIDFIDIGINERLRWAIFNVADAAVSVGLVFFVFLLLKREKREKIGGEQQ